MPPYNVFVPGYLASHNLTLDLPDPVIVAGKAGTMFGPIDADTPEEVGTAIIAAIGDGHAEAAYIWPEDAEDRYPPPADVTPTVTQESIMAEQAAESAAA